MYNNTVREYDEVIETCKDIFLKKIKDYGTSWRVLRTISVTDQLFIKALRVRNIQELKSQKVGDNIASEFMGIVNYGIIGLIQLSLERPEIEDLQPEIAENLYNEKVAQIKAVMSDKNHDYGEAWRELSQESMVDLILVKLMRIKQILANDGVTIISEGIDANFIDIVNYAVFGLILINEGKHKAL